MDKLYHPIRPKTAQPGSDSQEAQGGQIQQPIPKRRRLNTRVACNRCRSKRIAVCPQNVPTSYTQSLTLLLSGIVRW